MQQAVRGQAARSSKMPRDWSFDLGPGASVGAGMYPAKYSFDVNTASCSNDFVVFNTGGANEANLVAFNNLYGGCGGSVPSVMWAYATGAGGAMTSPVLSLDGTKVAFVQSAPGGAVLRIIQWRSGEGSFNRAAQSWTGVTPDNVTLSTWANCAPNQSCMISVPFAGAALDTNSPPFYDYATDALYVGDNNGALHKFTGVFNGAPVEVLSGWPLTLNPGAVLTGPAYDAVSGNVFVGDSTGKLWYVRESGSTVGACVSGVPPCVGTPALDVGNGSGRPIIDGPMIDPATERVFVFIGCALGASGGYGGATAEVVQTDTALGSVVRANLGLASTVDNLHDGIFDNNYFAGNYIGGHLYACGNPDSWQGRILYSVGFDANGIMSAAATAGPVITRPAANQCSPLSEADNNGADRIFLSVPSNGAAAVVSGGPRCTGACVYAYDVTSGNLTPATQAIAGLSVIGGSSGIIIDNTAAVPAGASQIYFSNLQDGQCPTSGGRGGCAAQASQAGLN